MYAFRIRFTLPDSIRLGIEDRRWDVVPSVSLRAVGDGLPIREAAQLALHGKSFESQEEAEIEGRHWRDALEGGSARIGVGVDFGERTARGAATEAGLKMLSDEHGGRFLNDDPGLSVFVEEPLARFVSVSAQAVKAPHHGPDDYGDYGCVRTRATPHAD